MAAPNTVIKNSTKGVTFISNVDRVEYTIKELVKGAMRDVGKYIVYEAWNRFYSAFKRSRRWTPKGIGYWFRSREGDLQIGVYNATGVAKKDYRRWAFLFLYQELGSAKQPKLGILSETVRDNINTIRDIQGKYLSVIENEQAAIALAEQIEAEVDENEV